MVTWLSFLHLQFLHNYSYVCHIFFFCIVETVEDVKRRYNIKYIRPPTDDEESDSDDENLDFLQYG